MIQDAQLETARLFVRPFEDEDVDALVDLFADPDVRRYVDDGRALSRADAALWVRNSRRNLRLHGYGTGAVVERPSGRLIGWAGMARPDEGGEELIYGLARPFWNRGLGRELLAALVDFATERGIDPLRATVHPDNKASIALLERQGFRRRSRAEAADANDLLFERQADPSASMVAAPSR